MAKSKEAALIGEVGETFVANHLKKKGYAILARNWRIKDGEIDFSCVIAKRENYFC